MKRIVVIGTTGAGKTTLANLIAARLRYPHIELDAFFWEPNWIDGTQAPRDYPSRFTTRDARVDAGDHTGWMTNQVNVILSAAKNLPFSARDSSLRSE